MNSKSVGRLIAEPLLIALVLAVAVRGLVRIYVVPSASMVPMLKPGDHIVVTPYRWSEPRRGDIIVFRSPVDSSQMLVKRVIAVAGDLVDTRLGRVRIGEKTLAEPYVLQPSVSGTIAAQIVPPGSYFVMGDNRAESVDSRTWGAVPQRLVLGRVRLVLW